MATRIVKGGLVRYEILCWVCGPCVAPGNQGADLQTGVVSGSAAHRAGLLAKVLGFKKFKSCRKARE